jgi:Antitoxin-like ribbon-helix-helix
MKPMRPSLEALAAAVAPKPEPPANVVPGPGAGTARPRQDRPHVSLYLSKAVQREIKRIALEYDRKPHDLLIEGVNLMLSQYGRPNIAEIERQ